MSKESEEPIHQDQFYKTLKRMKEAQNLGRQIKYQLGYSNFTFELWIILHKIDFNTPLIIVLNIFHLLIELMKNNLVI